MADPASVPRPAARSTRSSNPIFAASGPHPNIQQRMAALAVSVRTRGPVDLPVSVRARAPTDQQALQDRQDQQAWAERLNTVIDLSETLDEVDEVEHEEEDEVEHEEEDEDAGDEETEPEDEERSPLPATPQQAGPRVPGLMDATIDLTDSPPPRLASPPPAPPSPASPYTGPLSAIQCPICLDSLAAVRRRGRTILSTICGHVFCSACLPRALAATGRCPACRARLGTMDYHNLYLA